MQHFPKPEDPLIWIDELSDRNYVVIDDFLDDQMYRLIKSFFLERVEEFQQAGIGALHQNQIKTNIRGDLTYWLDRQRDTELVAYWELMQETIDLLNRYCFLSLNGFEFHLAHYPAGSFYHRHLDQFSNRSNRIISMIIYLNDNWQAGDGGELEIVGDHGEVTLIEPLAKRCVLFKSAEVLHGVLEAHKSRYSLTGWLLRHPSSVGYLLG